MKPNTKYRIIESSFDDPVYPNEFIAQYFQGDEALKFYKEIGNASDGWIKIGETQNSFNKALKIIESDGTFPMKAQLIPNKIIKEKIVHEIAELKTIITPEVIKSCAYFGINNNSLLLLSERYREPHRFYHDTNHILDILSMIQNYKEPLSDVDRNILIAAAIYHDAVYEITSKTNEYDSANLFGYHCANNFNNGQIVADIINSTSNHIPTSELSRIFCEFDLYGLKHGNKERVLKDEENIYKEYKNFHSSTTYEKGRVEFLRKFLAENNDINKENIEAVIEQVEKREN